MSPSSPSLMVGRTPVASAAEAFDVQVNLPEAMLNRCSGRVLLAFPGFVVPIFELLSLRRPKVRGRFEEADAQEQTMVRGTVRFKKGYRA